MLLKKILPIFIASMAFLCAANAQITTSGISGFVKNKAGEALTGASIQATHQPTGTVYTATTTKGGRFEIANMNPGGPYKVVVSFVGFATETKTDIFLTLGENLRQDFQMGDKTTELTTVTITALKTAGSKTGSETNIGRDKLTTVPSVGRQLNDYVRFTPQAKITGTGGISLGGQNNRYNSFMIDGAVNNDVFGLSAQGTNGGQAGVPPISIDAIDQLTVQVSSFDAAIGNFTGGVINAVTKQGTNNLAGTVYYLFRNENLTGKRPTPIDSLRIKSTPFQNKTYGFNLGGPIIKNKLFFFVNAEIQKDERPQPFTPAPYPSGFNLVDSITKLRTYLTSAHSYDPGDYLNNPDVVDRTNIVTRIDWNLNPKNKITISYRYNKAERTNPNRSSNTSIAFLNGAQFFPSTTHSGSFELNSKISNRVNNKFRVSFTDVIDDRGFIGNPFPNVVINGYGSGNPVWRK
jgi:outer membrane receptor for ferrienterochelin and colicin